MLRTADDRENASQRCVRSSDAEIARGAVAGALGGMAGALAMDIFQHRIWVPHGRSEEDEITQKAAQAICARVCRRYLLRRQRKNAGLALHYLTGTTAGAAYGIFAELVPVCSGGLGLPFGAGLWLIADELLAPALRLANPRRSSTAGRINELAAHLVYATTAELVRRSLRKPPPRKSGN